MALAFFTNISEFRKWANGIDASVNIDDVEASYNPAEEIVHGILEDTLWDLLKAYHLDPTPASDEKTQMVKYIQNALANFTMIQEFPYQAASAEKDWYKYEVDGMITTFRDNGWTALNNMIVYLDANTTIFTDWPSTAAYTERQKLIISDYKEFDKIYSIDGSAYFFYRITFLQKEVVRDFVLPRIETWDSVKDNANIADPVKYFIVYQTMANALLRFDYTNLPKSIRNLVINEYTRVNRSGYKESDVSKELAATLQIKANKYLSDLDYEIGKLNATDDEEEYTPNLNDEDNKFYLAT